MLKSNVYTKNAVLVFLNHSIPKQNISVQIITIDIQSTTFEKYEIKNYICCPDYTRL